MCVQVIVMVRVSHSRCHGGVKVAGWNMDREIRVLFPAYPKRVWVL